MGRKQKEFLTFFPNCAGCPKYVISLLRKGVGQICSVHSALWKFFLLVLPETPAGCVKPEQWIEILSSKRADFDRMKEDLGETQAVDIDADPLNVQSKGSEWGKIFEEQDLKAQIKRDVVRAFPEIGFFQSSENLQAVEDILFIFCKKHPEYGYPQGLHELAAFIFLVFTSEMKRNGSDKDVVSVVFCSKYVFTDSFLCFEKLAESIEPLYRPSARTSELAYCAELATQIQEEFLEKESRPLAQQLKKSGVQAQAYMLKWLRLLFLGVFDIESIKSMWDLIMSQLPSLEVVAKTCVALLLNAEGKLLKSDPTEILQFLFHYPQVPYPARFVTSAIDMVQTEKRGGDVALAIAGRLSEIATRLGEVCSETGNSQLLPFVKELKRTRDVLAGVISLDDMLPLEQEIQMATPTDLILDESSDDQTEMDETMCLCYVSKSESMPIQQPHRAPEIPVERKQIKVQERRRVRLFDDDCPKPKGEEAAPADVDLLGNRVNKQDDKKPSGVLFEEKRRPREKGGLFKRKAVDDLFK